MRTTPPPKSAPDCFVIADYGDLVDACRARRIHLRLSQMALDAEAGLPVGYTGKVEISASNRGAKNARSIGRDSLPLILAALGAKLVLVPDGAVLAVKVLTPAEAGARGGRARRDRLSPERRAEIARAAAQARWAAKRKETMT